MCQSLRIGTKTRGELAPEDMRTHKFFWFTFWLCMQCKSSREGRISSSGDAGSFGGEHSTSIVVCSASHQKHKALKKQKRKQRLKTEKPKANKEEPKENKRELRNQRQANRNQRLLHHPKHSEKTRRPDTAEMLQIEGAELQIAERNRNSKCRDSKHLRSLESLNCDPPLFLQNPKKNLGVWGL